MTYNSSKTGAQVDGAVTDVQAAKAASPTDTTAGRLLKVGDFGVGDTGISIGTSASGIRIDQGFADNRYLLLVKHVANGGSVQGRIVGERRDSGSSGISSALLDINVSGSAIAPPAISYSRIGNRLTRLVLCDYLGETWVAVETNFTGFNSELELARFFGNVGSAVFDWQPEAAVTNVIAAPQSGNFKFNDNTIYHTGNTIVDVNGFIKEA